MQFVAQFFEFNHDGKMPNSGHHSNIIQESTITQVNDLKSEICNEENAQEFSNRDIFKFIAFDSHFHLYLDIFASRNLFPLCNNVTPQNREVDINELPINFYQDRKSNIDYSFGINIPSCFDTLDEIAGNSNECREVIYDSYFHIKDTDLSSFQLNPHNQSQITCEN